jgi:hypothetical protein
MPETINAEVGEDCNRTHVGEICSFACKEKHSLANGAKRGSVVCEQKEELPVFEFSEIPSCEVKIGK